MTTIGRASTVIVYRHTLKGYEVLMTKRSSHVTSFPGHWVFPGGKENPEDRLVAASLHQTVRMDMFIDQEEFQQSMVDDFLRTTGRIPVREKPESFQPLEWLSLLVTGLRELWEETGLAYSLPALTDDDRQAVQSALLEGESLHQLMVRYHYGLDVQAFTAIGRITTPNFGEQVRRFDTAFFLARDLRQSPILTASEVTQVEWVRPKAALTRFNALLAIPTRYILMQLAQRWEDKS
ncbi:hypothetical protein [Sulfobacillus thermosulfidooxidans]|uniref:hypothetical protein n=1 Tax=Sulfobacillus thermosulfidooxidans TaxID=28034 RepID=UPI0006B4AC00|nr:hypothetical protein [Sulfobacillus thermosulfidooxidans]